MCEKAPSIWKVTLYMKLAHQTSFSEESLPFSSPWSTAFSFNDRPLLFFLLGDWNTISWSVFGRTDHKELSSLYIRCHFVYSDTFAQTSTVPQVRDLLEISKRDSYGSHFHFPRAHSLLSVWWATTKWKNICYKPPKLFIQISNSKVAHLHWLMCRVPPCRSCSCGVSLGSSY